jgi:MYXO-CTERM domain-containing protein
VNTGFALAFAVQGGSGAGYVWALTTHASGGTLNASTGAYVAGNTAGSDVLRVTDSLGNTGGATITVKAVAVPTGDGGVDSGTDSGVLGDAAVADAAPERDAAPGADGGFTLDAGARDGAADGGSGSSPSKSCGCTVVDASSSNIGGGLGALLGIALLVRRRRTAAR